MNRFVPVIFNRIIFLIAMGLMTATCDAGQPLESNGNSLESPAKSAFIFNAAQPETLARLIAAVEVFRSKATEDYVSALSFFASRPVMERFVEFDDTIWVDTPPDLGWSYFFSVSPQVIVGSVGPRSLVAFFNPWSDVFLITVWDLEPEIPALVDAELILGELVRDKGGIIDFVPCWLSSDAFKPFAVASCVAESVKAIERRFPASVTVERWRSAFPWLADRQTRVDFNYSGIALKLLNNLWNIEAYRSLSPARNPRLAECRSAVGRTLTLAARGELDALLTTADQTLPATNKLLGKISPEWFTDTEITAVVTGSDGCLAFLVPLSSASGFVSMLFSDEQGAPVLRRVDMINYQGFYEITDR